MNKMTTDSRSISLIENISQHTTVNVSTNGGVNNSSNRSSGKEVKNGEQQNRKESMKRVHVAVKL
jgi:hypothetical protein